MSQQIKFLYGENLLSKSGVKVSPGTVYLDLKTKELYYDDPTKTSATTHEKIIDADTLLYSTATNVSFPSQTIVNGWLSTRDGKKFAPATLIDNIFTSDGKLYDTVIKNYIDTPISTINQDLTILKQYFSLVDASTKDLGTSLNFLYIEDGVIKASAVTSGSNTKFIYLKDGTVTASTATVGSGIKLMYLSNGTFTASSSSVGGSAAPVYLKSGVITAISAVDTAHGGTGATAHTANRLVWSAAATQLKAENHYANATKIAVNSTTEPTQNFYVNGSAGFNGNVLVNNGILTIHRDTSKANDYPSKIIFEVKQTDNNITTSAYIATYDDHDTNAYGTNMVIASRGSLVIGGGESAEAFYTAAVKGSSSEATYVTSDGNIYFYTKCDSIDNRVGVALDASRQFYPILASANSADGSLGTVSNNWSTTHTRTIKSNNTMTLTPTSTMYIDSGSGSSIIFRPQGVEQGRFNTAGKLLIRSGGAADATIEGPATAGTFKFPDTGGTFVTHATKGTAVGSSTKPVYIASTGRATAGSSYAGGTKVTLNGTEKGATTAAFYAPTTPGSSGQVLTSKAANTDPTWVNQRTLDVGKLEGYTRSNLYADLPAWLSAVGLTYTITVDGDKDTYYPVRIYLSSEKSIPTIVSVYKNLGSPTPAYATGNHSNGTSSMWIVYEGRNGCWDGNGGYLKTLRYHMPYATLCANVRLNSGACGDIIIWLRGGGCEYKIATTSKVNVPTIYYTETNVGTTDYPSLVAPQTDLENKGIYSSVVLGHGDISGNASTATKLKDSRNIFGKSFNGTADIAGQALVYGTYTSTASQRYVNGGLQIREAGLVGSAQTDIGYAPSIGFHWSGKKAASLLFHQDGLFYFRAQDGTSRATVDANIQGNASTATALTSSAGSGTQPIYFSNGKPVATTYALNKTVPSNAVFTDVNVTQGKSTTSGWRPVLSHNVYHTTYGTDPGGATGGVYYTPDIAIQSSTGTIKAPKFEGELKGIAENAKKLNNYYSTRPTTLSPGVTGDGSVQTFKCTSSVTDTDDPGDGHILHFNWDNTGGYDSQILLMTSSSTMKYRGMNGKTWQSWVTSIDSGNYTQYTVKKDGTGASGTWNIDISGTAAKATYLTSRGAIIANTRTQSSSQAVLAGGWSTNEAGFGSQYGTTLDISGFSTWYHRLAFHTGGEIDYWIGINTNTLTKKGRLLTSANYTSYALPRDGSVAMTGVLHLKAEQYTDSITAGALNANNSNIYGVNSIYTADLADSASEGIHFYRTSTTVDSLWGKNGVLYFSPNRTVGSGSSTDYTILHTGNYKTYALARDGSNTMTGALQFASSTGTWAATANYANSLILFGGRNHNEVTSRHYFPWMGGYDGVNSKGYLGTITMGLFHGVPSDSGLFIGASWDGANADTFFYFTRSGTFETPRAAIGGYNNTSYALSTSSFICNSRVRTTGSNGWYNETYDGGWYMADGTYVRSYSSKPILIGNTVYIGTSSGDGKGVSLYNTSDPTTHGIHMSTTGNYGKHGDVQSDWATYFNMNAVGQRGWIYRAGSTNVASISANGIGTFSGVAKDVAHIISPSGGHFTTTDPTKTGYLKITLPVSWNRAMIRFTVDIYDYTNNNIATYVVGGYNYSVSSSWICTSAQCITKRGDYGDLKVRFGHDGTKCAIYIGESTTTWHYPQVIVHDVLLGYSQASNIADWSKNWSISFTTTLGTITSEKTDTNILHDQYLDNRYVNVTGDTMTGLLTTTEGNNQGIKVGNTYITAINGELIFQNNTAIRFGGNSWDYNIWAGLKYVHSSKTIYLGVADDTQFTANSAQSGGTLALPGISYLSINGKEAINAGDSWLRINQNGTFSSGTYFGSTIVRTDYVFQVGSSGNKFYANSDGNGYFSNNLTIGGTTSAAKKITLTGTESSTANIAFSRAGYNYITFPSNGNLAFATATNGDGIVVGVSSSSMYPYTTNVKTLGDASHKWKEVYATKFIGDTASIGSGGLNVTGDIITNGKITCNANKTVPFSSNTNLYFVNKAVSWNTSSHIQHVILLTPVLTTTNFYGMNYIDGKFMLWKEGANIYDVVEININCVYNNLRYYLSNYGDHSNWELCICTYNGVKYYALNCPYHANPYTRVDFTGHINSSGVTGGTSTVSLPLDVPYYNENTATVLNSEVKNSITSTLTTSVVTSASTSRLRVKGGFRGSLYGTFTGASGGNILNCEASGGLFMDQYGNIAPKSSDANTWNIYKNSSRSSAAFSIAWATGNTTIAGTLTVGSSITASGNLNSSGYAILTTNTKTIQIGSQNASYCHYVTDADVGHWFNKNTYVQGDIYAGSSYNQKVLHAGNYDSYALPLTGGTLTGTLTIGSSTTSTSPGIGIKVHDLRSATINPGTFGDSQVNFYFKQVTDGFNGSDATRWMSIMHIKGWNGGSYSAWELAGNAENSSLQDTLRYRQGKDTTWGAWQSVLTDANFTTYLNSTYVNVTGDTMTGALHFANGTWNKVGDDAQFGDNNTGGSFAIQGLNADTNLKMVTKGATTYGTITWDGTYFKFSNRLYMNNAGTWASTANYANALIHFGGRNHDAVTSRYYFPWMGGYDGVNSQGYRGTATLGLFHGVPTDSGLFIGMSWDGANADKFFYFTRNGVFEAPTVSISGALTVGGNSTLSGNIIYANGNYSDYEMIKFITGNGDGAGIVIGGGGLAVFGSGESASGLVTAASLTGNTETTYITSDGNIVLFSNCQTIANRMGMTLDTSLRLHPNGDLTGSLGRSDYRWSTVYAGTFVGNLQGTSDYSNRLTWIGTNTINAVANDTTANWGAQNTSIHFYTQTGLLKDQPSQWGYILNVGSGSEVHQIWMTQASGSLFHRGGNSAGWSGTWRAILDSSNFTTYLNGTYAAKAAGNLTSANGYPSDSSSWGMSISANAHTNGATTGNDNYYIFVDSSGRMFSGYKVNSMTTPTWTQVITANNIGSQTVAVASKLGTSTLGSTTKPIYLSGGTATACSTYAGGTAVTLNNVSKAASTATIYAPTSGSTEGNILIAQGPTSAPVWSAIPVKKGGGTKALIVNYGSNTASSSYSTAMGYGTTASGSYSLALGYETTASGNYSVAEGYQTTASSYRAHAMGYSTTALQDQLVIGHYNTSVTAGSGSGTTGNAFIIGNGILSTTSNAFRVTYGGLVYSKGAYSTSGADYAEYFEWEDGNPLSEDRRGYFVTLKNKLIQIAQPGDYILGIISASPSIIGNGDEDWQGRYIYDEFGSRIEEKFEYIEKNLDENTGEIFSDVKIGTRWKENPNYDPSISYIQRADRPEWDAVGMIGVLSVRDDGTCEINGYCKVAKGGIATKAIERTLDTYRVIERVNDHIVKIIMK